jgi:hypothetical protein
VVRESGKKGARRRPTPFIAVAVGERRGSGLECHAARGAGVWLRPASGGKWCADALKQGREGETDQ